MPIGSLTRWGGSFVAWDCLSTRMRVPYESYYPLDDILTGQVKCENGRFALGAATATLLIGAHIMLLLTPVAFTALFLKAQSHLQPSVHSFTLVILSMFAFVLASLGEIGQHIFDNWLYINSRVSTYNFTFYFMTTASNAVLAAGLGTNKYETWLAFAACLTTPGSFLYAVAKGEVYMPTKANVPIWAGMFVTVMLFLHKAWQLPLSEGSNKRLYTGIILVTNAFGIFCAVQIVSTGYQAWHLLTASSFCTGLITEGIWIVRTSSKQRSHVRALNGSKEH